MSPATLTRSTAQPVQEPVPASSHPLFLLTHSHWDREWYRSFEEYRARLVDVIDLVLELQSQTPEFRHFHMDAQTIVYRDYLEVRPEREADLRRAIQEGRLSVGPFYLLNDEFLCSGEAWVENLLFGAEDCRRWNASSKLCYVVDNFGHISQLPQIAREFGLKYFYGIRGWPFRSITRSNFWVEGADGSRLLALCHPWNYGLVRELIGTDEAIRERLKSAVQSLESIAEPDEPLLLMNGIDHAAPSPNLARIVQLIREIDPHSRQVSFDDFFSQLEKRDLSKLPVKTLETRFVPGLYDVLSSRMPQKIAYEHGRYHLEELMDPLCALALAHGMSAPLAQRQHAWRRFLENLPHDSVSGCSKDEVHEDIEVRLRQSREVAQYISDSLFEKLNGGTEAPMAGSDGFVATFNPLPYSRSEVGEIVLDFPIDAEVYHWQLWDMARDTEILSQILSVEKLVKRLPTEYNVPVRKPFLRVRLAAEISLSALGINRIGVRTARGSGTVGAALYGTEDVQTYFPMQETGRLSPQDGVLENEFLRAELEPQGTWTLLDKSTGRLLRRQHLLESAPDLGDLYKRGYAANHPRTLSDGALRRVSLVHNGPVLATYQLDFVLRVPKGYREDFSGVTEELVDLPVQSRVTLRKGAACLEFETTIDNTAQNHCLRALFPCGFQAQSAWADSIFDIVQRPIRQETAVFRFPYFQPYENNRQHHREFFAVSEGAGGLAVLSTGLPEHEVTAGENSTLALTLLRATGYIYRESMGEVITPGGQCPGKMTARYALAPFAAKEGLLHVKKLAREFNTPPLIRHLYPTCDAMDSAASSRAQPEQAFASVPLDMPQIEVASPLILSAFKPTHDRHGAVIRVYNPTDHSMEGRIALGFAVEQVQESSLSESPGSEITLRDNGWSATVKPKKIATWLVRFP